MLALFFYPGRTEGPVGKQPVRTGFQHSWIRISKLAQTVTIARRSWKTRLQNQTHTNTGNQCGMVFMINALQSSIILLLAFHCWAKIMTEKTRQSGWVNLLNVLYVNRCDSVFGCQLKAFWQILMQHVFSRVHKICLASHTVASKFCLFSSLHKNTVVCDRRLTDSLIKFVAFN